MSAALVLDRYDADGVARLFADEGVLARIARRGFRSPRMSVDAESAAPPCLRLHAEKAGREHLLFEVRLTRITIEPTAFPAAGPRPAGPISLVEIFWARQQDPTAAFSAERPRLPAQDHPGLGILRNVFRAGMRMASELGCDGLGNLPKLPHDAAIFQRTLGFSFLDPREQGRFDAMVRDLSNLSLRDFSLAVVAGAASDADGRSVGWQPGIQAFPLSAVLTEYVRGDAYAERRNVAACAARYAVNVDRLHAAIATLEAASAV